MFQSQTAMISEESPASLRSVPVFLFTINPFLSQLLGGLPLEEEESALQRRESFHPARQSEWSSTFYLL